MSAPRDELWTIALGLSARHRSQLKLLARQARREAQWARRHVRRWWNFEADYTHPLEIPAARRLVLYTWRLRPLARAVCDAVGLSLAVLLCERSWTLNAAVPGLSLFSAGLLLITLAMMGRRIRAALQLMRY